MQSSRWILAAGGTLMALAMVGGALGEHGLRARLTPDHLQLYETALRYHFYNALGLLAIGLAARFIESRALRWAAALIIAGLMLFCGSILALAMGAPRGVGVFTPIGGVALIAGWIVFASGFWRV